MDYKLSMRELVPEPVYGRHHNRRYHTEQILIIVSARYISWVKVLVRKLTV